tara:strand:+ start:1623 stop:2015 length:393 start_codon:yes stop_codon:yes gene_type:complete
MLEDKIKKMLFEKEWTFAHLMNTNSIVEEFSEKIFSDLSAKEKLDLVWDMNVLKNEEKIKFAQYFYLLVSEKIKIETADILKREILNANVNFGDKNKNKKEEDMNEISKRSLVGKSHKRSKTVSEKDSEE